jgi:nucleoside-diphosphate-sugar epimerase
MTKTVLMSGINGFVGRNLHSSLLQRGHEVWGISRNATGKSQCNWKYVLGHGHCSDVWIHLAGKAHDIHGKSDLAAYDAANYELTCRFFDAFCKSDANVFIFMSSVKAVADKVEGVLKESDVPSPQTPYGVSKLKAEKYLLDQLPEGKKVYILRPCMIHGPGNKGNLSLLFKLVKKGIPWPLAAFENKRSFLSIDNLCVVIDRLLQGQVDSGVYHLADDESLSTNDLISLMGEAIGREVRLCYIPPALIRIMARIGDILHLPLNSSRLQKLTESYVVDNNKIKAALQIELPINAFKGLSQTIKSFQGN